MKGMCLFLAGLCLLSGSFSTLCKAVDDDADVKAPHGAAFGQAPLILYRSYVFTRVSVNGGKEQTFMVDNGCIHTSIHPRTIGKGGFTRLTEHAYNTINKKQLVDEYGVIPSLKIGNLEITDHKVRLTEFVSLLSKQLQLRINGILGFETLREYLTVFDFESETIYFIDNSIQNVESIRALDGLVRCPFLRSPFSEGNVHIFSIEMLINNERVKAFLDLGFPGEILTSADCKKLGLEVDFFGRKTEVSILGQKGAAYPTSAGEVRIAGHTRNKVGVLFLDSEGTLDFTLLGVGFLKNFTLVIDYGNKEIYLGPRSSELSHRCLAFLTGGEAVD